MSNISQAELRTIIEDPHGTETLVRQANSLGKSLKGMGLTTSQIRALFGEVRQIQAQWDISDEHRQRAFRRLILLKPKTAYRARKVSGKAVEELVSVLDQALDLVIEPKDKKEQDERFRRFVEFFEAILAYHRAYGGK